MPIFESYSRKTEKKGKHEQNRREASAGGGANSDYNRQYSSRSTSGPPPGQPYVTSAASSVRNGYSQHNGGGSGLYRAGQTVAPMEGQRYYDTAWSSTQEGGRQRQGFSKSSSYEMKEHYERKSRKKGAGGKAVQEKVSQYALNEDANKLMSEIDPNDPMAHRLKDELRATNEHFYDLLNKAQKGPEPDYSNQFDEKMAELLKKLEEAWKKLNNRVGENVPQNLDDLERLIHEHKNFEDALQALDVDVSNVKELFRQLPNPTPTQRANLEHMNGRWEDLWDLSRMYVERLKALEAVLQGLEEVTDIVRRHEITLSSFDDLPAALDKLRGVHSQLIELNMVLQQQQEYVQTLNKNVAQLRQHVARTRFNVSSHPDVDRLEEAVQNRTVRWDNVCSQVAERLKTAEETQQTQMIYRSQYDEEILWLDRVEATINSLRRPEDLRPEELQSQLDQLVAEYAQLQEHTATIENINKEGGKFIRDAKSYDIRLNQFHDNVLAAHGPGIRSEFRRQIPQSKNGAQIVTEELEALNRRFAQLSSVILERKNIVNVLIQNWRRKQQIFRSFLEVFEKFPTTFWI